ncbi:VOC family protein [Spirosoma utsteinense]|uniref:Catechol 2,3-dioxygenase-like lactoylglutathione lyase family enzyme n=1 Tax=Spirosoma utsteinense TaxID=2585773 RepID=A0ABR6W214_9BACT|nr:VOC family protein [Spirosoma utsteinense]MBC3785951.1 catechol 2,3-dioxygenase-like lactoylglutathione lyase family enzyme [Spirosoma utsteinense]MBC3790649.1 catechol 2,3-dioxygenase-like lactoylglutathione lyase family enzyme [Spirosoma utsteinense]
MSSSKSTLKNAWPYQQDRMNLPVADLETAVPFYETMLGFRVILRSETPHQSAVLERDGIQIGLAENGGDPEQDGCFFEVDDVEKMLAEVNAAGFDKVSPDFQQQKYGDVTWKVLFVVAPDGLCYSFGERQN